MTYTITATLPTVQQITRGLSADWGPALRRAAGAIAAALVAVYTAGLIAGLHWQRFNRWIDRHHLHGLARLGLPGAPMLLPAAIPHAAPIVQHHATITLPTLNRREACRRLRAQGMSPAAIGRELGCSRSTVRRELAA